MNSNAETPDPLSTAVLRALDVLSAVARHLDPSLLTDLAAAVQAPLATLQAACPPTPNPPATDRETRLRQAGELATGSMRELQTAATLGDLRGAYKALRRLSLAREALYPLAAADEAIATHFLPAAHRARPSAALVSGPGVPHPGTGVHHHANDRGTRGGHSVYVPEHYDPQRAWPLVMALHGGSGHGRDFLWSWLADARWHGAIVVAPTSSGRTWPIQDEDTDTARLQALLAEVRREWHVDATRMLLTGMSDGGTFSYLAGLQTDSPFTHLAPIASAFHPMLIEVAEASRLRGLPVFVTHGVQDWMFPVDIARQAARALAAAGADVTYAELPDLSHCYPAEMNTVLLDWLDGKGPGA